MKNIKTKISFSYFEMQFSIYKLIINRKAKACNKLKNFEALFLYIYLVSLFFLIP